VRTQVTVIAVDRAWLLLSSYAQLHPDESFTTYYAPSIEATDTLSNAVTAGAIDFLRQARSAAAAHTLAALVTLQP